MWAGVRLQDVLMTHERWPRRRRPEAEPHAHAPYGVDGYLSTFLTFKPEIAWRYWRRFRQATCGGARGDPPITTCPFDYLIASPGSFDARSTDLRAVRIGQALPRPLLQLNDRQMEELRVPPKIKVLTSVRKIGTRSVRPHSRAGAAVDLGPHRLDKHPAGSLVGP